MRSLLILAILSLALPAAAEETNWRVCVTPDTTCAELFVDVLANARHQVLVQAHRFSSQPILTALKNAHARGVDVRVIVDDAPSGAGKSGREYDLAARLCEAGIPVWVVPTARNQFVVIDGDEAIVGSFSFTADAQDPNPENLLLIGDSDLAAMYRENWLRKRALATPYAGLPPAAATAQ